jgi:hypothetical protein
MALDFAPSFKTSSNKLLFFLGILCLNHFSWLLSELPMVSFLVTQKLTTFVLKLYRRMLELDKKAVFAVHQL